MTIHHTKIEDPWAMNSLAIDQKILSMDRQTDMCKAIYPLFFEGGHNNKQFQILILCFLIDY